MIPALIVGGICGYIASVLMKGKGMGIIMNIILGIVGYAVGEYVFSIVGFRVDEGALTGQIIQGVVGAALLISLARIIAR